MCIKSETGDPVLDEDGEDVSMAHLKSLGPLKSVSDVDHVLHPYLPAYINDYVRRSKRREQRAEEKRVAEAVRAMEALADELEAQQNAEEGYAVRFEHQSDAAPNASVEHDARSSFGPTDDVESYASDVDSDSDSDDEPLAINSDQLNMVLYRPPMKGYVWDHDGSDLSSGFGATASSIVKGELENEMFDGPSQGLKRRRLSASECKVSLEETEMYMFDFRPLPPPVDSNASMVASQAITGPQLPPPAPAPSSSSSTSTSSSSLAPQTEGEADGDQDALDVESSMGGMGGRGGRAFTDSESAQSGGDKTTTTTASQSAAQEEATVSVKSEGGDQSKSSDPASAGVPSASQSQGSRPLVSLRALADLLRTKSLESMKHRFYTIQELLKRHRDQQSRIAAEAQQHHQSDSVALGAQTTSTTAIKEEHASVSNESGTDVPSLLPSPLDSSSSSSGPSSTIGCPDYLLSEPSTFNPVLELARRRFEDRATRTKLAALKQVTGVKQETGSLPSSKQLGLGQKRARVAQRMIEIREVCETLKPYVPTMVGDGWEESEGSNIDKPELMGCKSEASEAPSPHGGFGPILSPSVPVASAPIYSDAPVITSSIVPAHAVMHTGPMTGHGHGASAAAAAAAAAEVAAAVAAARAKDVYTRNTVVHPGPPVVTPQQPLLLKWALEDRQSQPAVVESVPQHRYSYYPEVDLRLTEGPYGFPVVIEEAAEFLQRQNESSDATDTDSTSMLTIVPASPRGGAAKLPSPKSDLNLATTDVKLGPDASQLNQLDSFVISKVTAEGPRKDIIARLAESDPALYEAHLASQLEVLDIQSKVLDAAIRGARKVLNETQKAREREAKLAQRQAAKADKLAMKLQQRAQQAEDGTGEDQPKRRGRKPSAATQAAGTGDESTQGKSSATTMVKVPGKRGRPPTKHLTQQHVQQQQQQQVQVKEEPIVQTEESVTTRPARVRPPLIERRPRSVFDDSLPGNPGPEAPPSEEVLEAVRIVAAQQEAMLERQYASLRQQQEQEEPASVYTFQPQDLLDFDWSQVTQSEEQLQLVRKVAEQFVSLGHMLTIFTDPEQVKPSIFQTLYQKPPAYTQSGSAEPSHTTSGSGTNVESTDPSEARGGVYLQSDVANTLHQLNYTAIETHPLSTAAPSAAAAAARATVAAAGNASAPIAVAATQLANDVANLYSLQRKTVDTLMSELGLKRASFKVPSARTYELYDTVRAQALQCLALQHWIHLRRKLRDDVRQARGLPPVPPAPPGSTVFPTTTPPPSL